MKYRFSNEFTCREFEQLTTQADTLEEAWRQWRVRFEICPAYA